ncbi:armadillo-type protein [Mycena metata]|uniref:Nucleolar protein 9 n=1 Tax=Mycena metata TaxID=1033252 RepID=A0AAD7MNM6_9AGAR|nr:armadillo-type protein [Mycena metata]
MPKELRKRGKKKKPEPEWQPPVQEPVHEPPPKETPSWIVSAPKPEDQEDVNPEAPFGYVEVDVKAYFRTVDIQIRDWQNTTADATGDEDSDPNEERRMFFVAALTEMGGKEKQLATDPDCSLILERMSYSMDDFVRRVFVDSLIGSYDVLVKHRFASHVCQTLFTVAAQTVSREHRSTLTLAPETRAFYQRFPESSDKGELRTLTQLIIDVCEELLPVFPSLVMNPFASHVIRALLLLLSPNLATSQETAQHTMRSKKSAAWKAKQGPLKSVFNDSQGSGADAVDHAPPEVFTHAACKFVEALRSALGDNETRALAADKVASPTLQMLLAVEADQQMTEDPDSLMDRVLVGLVSASREPPASAPVQSDYLNTLLRDPTSSHLLETIVSRCPAPAFSILWATYFKNNLPRIASHPVANFVLAKAAQLREACAELHNVWPKQSRTGVLRAAIDRAAALKACGSEIIEAVLSAFRIESAEERTLLVPCMLRLQTLPEYTAAKSDEPKVQGAVLLQSLLRLPEPHNQLVSDSLNSLSPEDILNIAHHAISSRVLDALLDSPTVPLKAKRQFVLSFLGRYHLLVDDRIGSRVGDRCWAFCDTYLKEKIARSLIPHESFLAASFYGKFFARNLNLYLLQRRPDEWRTMQTERSRPAESTAVAVSAPPAPAENKKGKRKREGGDEIDALFGAALGKKVRKAALVEPAPAKAQPEPKAKSLPSPASEDAGLADVLGAIRAAPEGSGKAHGKRKGR